MLGREIVPGKSYEIDLGLNQSDLASMAGAKREWVNRLLQKWRKSGLIDYHRGKFTIHDLDALTAERDRRMSVLGNGNW
jgi:CRP-like cAMP-binding protein